MRNNGGFILIKINKSIDDLTANDFDKNIFREIVKNQVKKPLILQTLLSGLVFQCYVDDVSCEFRYVLVQSIEEDGTISGYVDVSIAYNSVSDELTYQYTEI